MYDIFFLIKVLLVEVQIFIFVDSKCFQWYTILYLPANLWFIGFMMQVDMTALKQMGENDLKELGIPMVCLFFMFLILYLGFLLYVCCSCSSSYI